MKVVMRWWPRWRLMPLRQRGCWGEPERRWGKPQWLWSMLRRRSPFLTGQPGIRERSRLDGSLFCVDTPIWPNDYFKSHLGDHPDEEWIQ
ncbi:hypothetical protein RHGRI_029385 [Rhododendron griersonianum]|uniref:Uncharacterized protein n=1 Tax=Rhododendron griersonianum TaxID=479676 RepID=A0AAV6IJZ5_9ERIC|nr:hypothetical protein RHGRI_029385 [Rhododendron griersonianum]